MACKARLDMLISNHCPEVILVAMVAASAITPASKKVAELSYDVTGTSKAAA